MKDRFKGKVRSRSRPAKRLPDCGEGEGGVAGLPRAAPQCRCPEVPEGTKLAYGRRPVWGGKIAQMGQRLLAGSAKKIAYTFFNNFTTATGGAPKA